MTLAAVTGVRFTSLTPGVNDVINLVGISANALNCFLEGTKVATPLGGVPVENLKSGDQVLTADGRVERVLWLGHQWIDTRVSHPAKVNPICISAGALGDGLPQRDLYLSPDHAVALDGILVNAGALVNDATIYKVRDMPQDRFTYYHVETEAHELLLAEGVAAESFLDVSVVFHFDNVDGREMRTIQEMDLPRISSARLVPQSVRARYDARAAMPLRRAG